jgi:anti-sigma B factor antagonist
MATSDPQRVTAAGLSAFRVEIRSVVDGTGEVVVEGEVDVATAPQLREALHQAIDEGATRLRIDLAEVGFIDSAGLGVLIGVLKRIREAGGEIDLAHVQPAPRKVIEITGLDELFALAD